MEGIIVYWPAIYIYWSSPLSGLQPVMGGLERKCNIVYWSAIYRSSLLSGLQQSMAVDWIKEGHCCLLVSNISVNPPARFTTGHGRIGGKKVTAGFSSLII